MPPHTSSHTSPAACFPWPADLTILPIRRTRTLHSFNQFSRNHGCSRVRDHRGYQWKLGLGNNPSPPPNPATSLQHANPQLPSQNKTLSDSPEPTLTLQGIGYLTRKAIGYASIVLEIHQYEGPPRPPSTATDTTVTIIDITQTVSGLASTEEKRCLDNEWRGHSDFIFGEVRGQSRWVTLDEVEDPYLKANWEKADRYVWSFVESVGNGWKGTQVWGFQIVDGERRYARNIVVTKGDKRVETRLVYDYRET